MRENGLTKKNVLVCVLKSARDRDILLKSRWYRIPVEFFPARSFTHLAFYQPANFGKDGKRIAYYAKVLKKELRRRAELLPRERAHPRVQEYYWKITVGRITKLPRPVKNMIPRRVSFGFTSIKDVRSSRHMLALYHVLPAEQIVAARLRREGITTIPQYQIEVKGKRFRADLAIVRPERKIVIECDNRKAHSGKVQKQKDKLKNAYLRRAGWRVIRLKEKDVAENLDVCIKRIFKNIVQ